MRLDPQTLTPFFKPRGVAVVGASSDPTKLSYGIMANLLHPQHGFPGPVYPVNPKAEEILGKRCYPGILSVPDPIELAVVIVPAEMVLEVLEDCGKRGVRAAIIISGGFREVGPEGAERERLALEVARRYGMRLMGPNGIGVIDTHTPLNTTFAPELHGLGFIDFVSQSGALCGGIIDWAQARGLHFSRFLSIGNKVDVDEIDLLNYLAEDDLSRVITLYLEDVRDGPAFLEAARKAARHKPVLALKTGRTMSGQAATASHTGALAGVHSAFRAACKQAGVIEVENIQEMFNAALALAHQPLPKGNRIAILTNAGGPSALAADSLNPAGLTLAHTSPEIQSILRAFLNPQACVDGPVDMLGGAGESHYRRALEALLADPGNDGVLLILVPMVLIDPGAILRTLVSVIHAAKAGKPVLACLMGEASLMEAFTVADQGDLPAYRFPEEAVRAFGIMRQRAVWLETKHPLPAAPKGVKPQRARDLLSAARQNGRTALDAAAGRAVLEAYGVQTPKDVLAASPEEAATLAKKINFPVALKLASPHILHKTEVGGVLLNVADEDAAREGWQAIVTRARAAHLDADIRGVQVQQMVRGGQEVILGVKRDPVFGPLLMFGLGGVYVEALADVSFRLAPLSRQDAEEMIAEVRAAKLLEGLRGASPADRLALVDAILRIGQLAADCPEIAELDVNPLMVLPAGQGALAVDVRIILGETV
ncbi:MAG: acetate--CoA ligase family protein [Chloroflexota bacterium]